MDISDEGRIPESREELLKVLSNEKMIQIPLLVIANKKSQSMYVCIERERERYVTNCYNVHTVK